MGSEEIKMQLTTSVCLCANCRVGSNTDKTVCFGFCLFANCRIGSNTEENVCCGVSFCVC